MKRGIQQAVTGIEALPPYPGLTPEHITVVGTAAQAEAAAAILLAADAIGFDTESKPTFTKGEASTGPHLVQLASDDHAWLFPSHCTAALPMLRAILESTSIVKAGFGLGNDLAALRSRFGIDPAQLVDLGEVLRGPGHKGTVGARVAVAHFFGQRFLKSKKTSTSNWASPRLSPAQTRYAANDAHVALKVYRAWMAER